MATHRYSKKPVSKKSKVQKKTAVKAAAGLAAVLASGVALSKLLKKPMTPEEKSKVESMLEAHKKRLAEKLKKKM
ncbi:MAG TPA: hypothetical protein V6C58_10230 [Allocoleopsis sp.]